ncbi:MAG: hypothetical protein LUG98_00325 [Tannerellaceae bacterium]|nr:hypothetical protein [Tannerellaceae bacterium]
MKWKTSLLAAGLFLLTGSATGQLQEETRQVLFSSGTGTPYLIKPDAGISVDMVIPDSPVPQRQFLRVIGGTQMPGRFAPRGETLLREAEFLIDDHLDSLHVKRDTYSLYFRSNKDPYEQEAYYRIPGSNFRTGTFTLETAVKRKNGDSSNHTFGVKLEVFYKKEGYHPDEVYHTPDTILYMPLPSGNGEFELVRKEFTLSHETGSIVACVGGRGFSGEYWVEAPRFYQDGQALPLIPFCRFAGRDNDHNYWVGINLSSRFWSRWKLEWNGETIFNDHIFDRASDIADFYIPLPGHLKGNGRLSLTLVNEEIVHTFPYELRSLELIRETARDFEIVSVPRYPAAGEPAGILVEINKPGTTLTVAAGKEIRFDRSRFHFATEGLHVIPFTALEPIVKPIITISDGQETRIVEAGQIIRKDKDNIYISSGDEIHIDKEYEPYNYFFKWYVRERIGNWYQFRPSYQWSGVRITNEKIINHYTGLLNQLNMPYAWQVEGRTLAATRINPSLESLQSPMFRGKQAHENDGGYYYWRHFHYNGFHSDMAARTRPYGGIFAKHPPIYREYGTFIHYDPYHVKDMAHGARYYVENLRYSRGESTRHTGPSTTFRYLYQAGYEWLGAEQMYGPEETVMSALRGASRAYHKKEYGSLHAMQWGSFPFTDPKHAHRLFLSLGVAYLHGSGHINTEEALWLDEYANDRYSEAGKLHLYAQHQVYDFIETHTRRGELHAPIAVFQGRNDAWKSFGRGPLWSQIGKKWEFNKATESFDLMKIFYPGNEIDGCGPEGWFASTPYGPVDLLPIEADQETLSRYKALIFLGWNTFDAADIERITKFVEKGGILLLSAAHLNSELQPDLPVQFPEEDSTIKKLLGNNYRKLTAQTTIKRGKGRIIYFPQPCYPAQEEIRPAYEDAIREIATELNNQELSKGWIKAAPHIDYTVWDSQDRRTFYILNTDWQSDEATSHPATFLLNQAEFTIEVPRYVIATIHSVNDLGIYPESNTTDILEIKETPNRWEVTIQTTGKDVVHLFNSRNNEQSAFRIIGAGIETVTLYK